MSGLRPDDTEWKTWKRRIEPMLRAAGLRVVKYDSTHSFGKSSPVAIEEFSTNNCPADCALCPDGRILGVLEGKRLTIGPQNALTQADRYSPDATASPLSFRGFRVPFLYATNGEVVWHHGMGHPQSRPRRIAQFQT
jgi:type I restriction enzyme, R subunit